MPEKNGQINPPNTVRAARDAGGRPRLAAVLQEGREYGIIYASLGVIREISG